MSHREGQEPIIRAGRGRPFSREALTVLWQAAISRSPATDWTKGRLLVMGVTVLILVRGLGGLFDLVVPLFSDGTSRYGMVMEDVETEPDGGAKVAGPARPRERLRSDLFKVSTPKKENARKVPKTNPVELLRLLQFQGVLGGERPRAIVYYKRTKQTVTISVGDDLGEFKVMEIRERSVVLKWRDELFELSL